MGELLIIHGTIFTVDCKDRIIDDGALFVQGNRIVDIGLATKLLQKYPKVKQLDASGMVVLPGLINSHTHLSMTMTRSIADDIEAVYWLPVVWAVEKHLTPETVYIGALLGIAEMIASGTTTFNDHYFHMDQVARAVQETGIRADLAEAILENRNRKKGLADLEKGKELAREWHNKADGRIQVRIGPHALYTCSTELVVKARQAADALGVGMHMHVAESGMEMSLVGKDAKGPTTIQHLDKLGVLKSDFVGAHGLTINKKDVEILAEKCVSIAHCPQAYGKLGGYPFPAVDEWMTAGMNVCMGTDGVASNNNLDLFDEMRFGTLVRKLFAKDGKVLPARQMLRMVTINGAKALGKEKEIGSLEVGKKADIILVDFHKPHLTPFHNVPGHLVYSANGADVDTVIVDGKVLYKNRKFLTIQIDALLERAQSSFKGLLKKAGWTPTSEEPKVGLASTMKLRVTQQSLKVIEKLAWASETKKKKK